MSSDHTPTTLASTLTVAFGLLAVAVLPLAASDAAAAPSGCGKGDPVADAVHLGLLGSVPKAVDGVVAAEAWHQNLGGTAQWLVHDDPRMDEKLIAAGAVGGNPGLALDAEVVVYADCQEPPVCTLNPSEASLEVCHVEGSQHHIKVQTGPSACFTNHLVGCPTGGLVVADPTPNPAAP